MICPFCHSPGMKAYHAKVEPQGFFEHLLSEEALREKRGNPRTTCPRCGRWVQEYLVCHGGCGIHYCGACLV